MHLAESGKPLSALKARYAHYAMVKDKVAFDPARDPAAILDAVAAAFAGAEIDRRDGLKLLYPNGWVHLRKSNTEPILRIYAEAPDMAEAQAMADRVKARVTGA
jgi:phosphomannomutase